jgi:hypothetical protein
MPRLPCGVVGAGSTATLSQETFIGADYEGSSLMPLCLYGNTAPPPWLRRGKFLKFIALVRGDCMSFTLT